MIAQNKLNKKTGNIKIQNLANMQFIQQITSYSVDSQKSAVIFVEDFA